MQRRRNDRRWYKISVDTLRGWAIALTILAALAAGFFLYHRFRDYGLERQAAQVIEEARGLIQRAQTERGAGTFREEYNTAWESFQQARGEFAKGDYPAAIESARRCRNVLLGLFDSLRHHGGVAEGQFVSVEGQVEYRRGDSGSWEDARSRGMLRSGDYVRTAANGSAEILFLDGTLYTVRPNTQVVVSPSHNADGADDSEERSISMEYGWVDLSTSANPSKVTTPEAEARVVEESDAFVSYERSSQTGRFGAYRGSVEVSQGDGAKRRVSELHEVVATKRGLSQPQALPRPPQLRRPMDNIEINPDREHELVLEWQPVPGADRYALQVSRNRLFINNIIDVADRRKTHATLGIRGEGSFQWRVASESAHGVRGPWSPARHFRIASLAGHNQEEDHDPPELEITGVTSYGNIFIVEGKTEPGSTLEVNHEPVKVAADGSFTKPIQLTREGWGSIEVRARDASGNESTVNRPVFVEIP